MKQNKWEAIYAIYNKIERLCDHIDKKYDGDSSREVTEELIKARSEIRTQLDFLKATLSEDLKERDTYLVLFPVVAHIDEMIQTKYLTKMDSSWPLLQRELFQVENAGEMFFEILDDILIKPATLPFVFEVYYFCISYGFRGKYDQDPVRINHYLKSLKSRISPEEPVSDSAPNHDDEHLQLLNSPMLYYLMSFGTVCVVVLSLYIIAEFMC